MDKKYKLGKKEGGLYRIVALRDFGVVSRGEVGGLIEGEVSLSHSGDAWVSGNAMVSENARVSGDAWVSGNARVSENARVSGDARVYGNAMVSGDARVYGNARVYGDAWVSGDARVYGNAMVSGDARVSGGKLTSCAFSFAARHTINVVAPGTVAIGCHDMSLAEWKRRGALIAKQHGYTDKDTQVAKVGLFAAEGWMRVNGWIEEEVE